MFNVDYVKKQVYPSVLLLVSFRDLCTLLRLTELVEITLVTSLFLLATKLDCRVFHSSEWKQTSQRNGCYEETALTTVSP